MRIACFQTLEKSSGSSVSSIQMFTVHTEAIFYLLTLYEISLHTLSVQVLSHTISNKIHLILLYTSETFNLYFSEDVKWALVEWKWQRLLKVTSNTFFFLHYIAFMVYAFYKAFNSLFVNNLLKLWSE